MKVIYFCDISDIFDSPEDEFKRVVEPKLREYGIEFEDVKCTDKPPFDEHYDILFFDWGGMSLGNSLLDSFCRHILNEAEERPSTLYVMVSSFTSYAMEDAIARFEKDKPSNIFLCIEDFARYYKEL